MKMHKKSLIQCLAQNKHSINVVIMMMPLLSQTTATHSALWLQTWGGHQETPRVNSHLGQYPQTWYKPVRHLCISQTKHPESLGGIYMYGCTDSKWVPEVTSDMRTLKWKKIKSAQHAHCQDPTCLSSFICLTKLYPLLQSELNSLFKQFNFFHAFCFCMYCGSLYMYYPLVSSPTNNFFFYQTVIF